MKWYPVGAHWTVAREALSSVALDGQTVALGPLSTARPESIRWWWHPSWCTVLAGRCSCGRSEDER